MDGRVALVVMDGVGVRDEEDGNAFAQADTPTLDRLFAEEPYTELQASGEAVGLPEGYIGNSEVGHLHIGAGRVIPQELVRINEAIDDGSLYGEDALVSAADAALETDGTVHLMGIASDGGVHGHIDHITALMDFFADAGCDVQVHAFLDGRDVEPKSARRYLDTIQEAAGEAGSAWLGSFMGRYFAMDRDTNWDRTERAYSALVHGEGHVVPDVETGLEQAYGRDRNDYFVEPTLLETFAPIEDDDVVVFTNWRKDRARQLTRAFIEGDFDTFPVADRDIGFVTMMPYDDDFDAPTVMEEERVAGTVGEVLSSHGKSELRLTESQKEPHVTYFFDGQREDPFPDTDLQVFKSANVSAYDEKPEMEAEKITAYAADAFRDGSHDFVLVNYPNCDLVGHTGDVDAAVSAVETVDGMVGRLVEAARDGGYTLLLTSDHGNCEEMVGRYETSHTLNPVPFCMVNGPDRELQEGGLTNIAATIFELMDVEVPDRMDRSLFA